MRSSTTIARRRPSAGLVVGLIALFVALGGTSYAAVNLPKGSVGTTQLKDSAVTAQKLKANAIGSDKVKDGSLLAKDFKAGQLPAGPAGGTGPAGPQGPQGVPGPQGAPGVSGYEIVTGPDVTVPEGASAYSSATCPDGKQVIGGGYEVPSSTGVETNRSGPSNGGKSWFVRVTNNTGAAKTINVQAICVTVAL